MSKINQGEAKGNTRKAAFLIMLIFLCGGLLFLLGMGSSVRSELMHKMRYQRIKVG